MIPDDSPIGARVFQHGGHDAERKLLRREIERVQGFGVHVWNVTRDDERACRTILEELGSGIDCMAGTLLLLLNRNLITPSELGSQVGLNFFALVSNHHHDSCRTGFQRSLHDVPDDGFASDFVEEFDAAGLHSGALARGEHNSLEINHVFEP